MFVPTTREEMKKLGWDSLDCIIVTGDVYIDSPYDGAAIIAKTLIGQGYRAGIISQPDIHSDKDITRLGEPGLFWGVTAGCVDSMVANYTALKKPKRQDDLTPGGINNRRPDRAVIAYTNLIKQYFKNTRPVVLGGVEASLRRIAHYDYWSNSVRRSVLFDSKADILVYGMGEKTITELAQSLKEGSDYSQIRGICYNSTEKKEDYTELPSYDEVRTGREKFAEMFNIFYANNDPLNAKGLCQAHGNRWLVQNPPNYYLTGTDLDKVYEMDFERDVHPYYKKQGEVRALNTIQFSITSHRGCFGECNFCAIAVHQGRTIRSRSEESIIKEAKDFTRHRDFKGIISDVGGPTANMYGMSCKKQLKTGSCTNKRCAFPETCKVMDIDHKSQIELLARLRSIPRIKKIFVGSGLRYDLVIGDKKSGIKYLKDIAEHHVSGQLKIAPEHTSTKVLNAMGKPSVKYLKQFREEFVRLSKESGRKQFLTYYFIAAHPGCDLSEMRELKNYINKELKINPEQVQIFTPTPSTYSTLMYLTEMDPVSLKKIFVEKGDKGKSLQKEAVVWKVEKRAQSRELRAESSEQRAQSRELRAESSEQRAQSREPREES